MFNIKALIPTVVAVLVALAIYDLFVKKLVNGYDDTFDRSIDHFEKKQSNAKLRKLISEINAGKRIAA